MGNDNLKSCLITFPAPQWDIAFDLSQYSKSQVTSALAEILKEYGRFPVPERGVDNGLIVEGSSNRYIGSWTTFEQVD